MKNLKRLGVLLTAVGAICLLAGTQPVKATEKATIAEGVYIGNVNVGGMTQAQAQSAVEEYVAGLMDTTFTLKGESGSVSMTAQDMGVTADVNAAVTEAVAVGRAGSLINRYKTTQDLKKNSLVLDMHLSVDKQTTAQKLYKDSDKLSVAAVDNGLVRENGAFQFVKGKEGVEVNIDFHTLFAFYELKSAILTHQSVVHSCNTEFIRILVQFLRSCLLIHTQMHIKNKRILLKILRRLISIDQASRTSHSNRFGHRCIHVCGHSHILCGHGYRSGFPF